MTYLELVNKAIRESGVDLDTLTPTNFANPPDKYHEKFKEWVNDAWAEIQMERNWKFTHAYNFRSNGVSTPQGLATLITPQSGIPFSITTDYTVPVLILSLPNGPVNSHYQGGYWVVGNRSGAVTRMIASLQHDVNSSVAVQGQVPETGYRYRLYVMGGTTGIPSIPKECFEFGETISVYSNSPFTGGNLVTNNAGTVVDLNPYRLFSFDGLSSISITNNFPETTNSTDGIIPDKHSFKVVPRYRYSTYSNVPNLSSAVSNNLATEVGTYKPVNLKWLDWPEFRQVAYGHEDTMLGKNEALGIPKYVSIDDAGFIRLFPTFDYRDNVVWDVYCDIKMQTVKTVLNNANQAPIHLPKQYRDMIAWRAVMYYANDDSKPDKWRTARGRYEFYKRRLEEEMMEQPKWQDSPYKRGIGHGIR